MHWRSQILRLDDETRREETFQKIGDSEILNLEGHDEEDDERENEDERRRLESEPDIPDRITEVDTSPERNPANKTLTKR